MAQKKKNNNDTNKKHILFRYGIITMLFVVVAVAIVVRLFFTTIVEAEAWSKQAKQELSKVDTIFPERGNILSDNGNILACNLDVYDIKVDLRHAKVLNLKSIPIDTIEALADSLDKYYPRIEDLKHQPKDTIAKYSWHRKLNKEFVKAPGKRSRCLRLAKNKTMSDYNRIRSFPFFSQFKGNGYRHPLYKEIKKIRMYPYGRMAYRSIGRVNQPDSNSKAIHGYSGLEKFLDAKLYGKPGLTKKVAMTSGFADWVSVPAERGCDVQTTINIDFQDMLEEELHNICKGANAEWGTAIIMEVKTGEIKAISNIEKMKDGSYGEARNRAVLPFEPGSVMKPISLMIAFEDGLVHSVNDVVDCGPFQQTSDPHGAGMKTMKQVIEQSSNPGIARVIFRGYASNPAKFYDRLAGLGFFEPMHSGIAGECIPWISQLNPVNKQGRPVTMKARHLDLARQAYGYNTMLPPLFTLSVYNAIANGGKYVRPHLMRSFRTAAGQDSVVPIDYIRPQICSESTASKVGQCLVEVVWGDHGTAQAVQDDRVKIVGKTGTAYPVEGGKYNTAKRRYAFAGYFPYENPKYSCMALIQGPSGNSANRTSGQVVKNVAVKLFARGKLDNVSLYSGSGDGSSPLLAASAKSQTGTLVSSLGMNGYKVAKITKVESGCVPDVMGYDVATAVAKLEAAGLTVSVRGSGHVVAQSLAPGSKLQPGQRISLNLRL